MRPVLKEGDRQIPLDQCTPEQTEVLHQQLLEQRDRFMSLGKHQVVCQIDTYIQMVAERLEAFDLGLLERPAPPKKNFSEISILEDDED